jgi:hypothetical protein
MNAQTIFTKMENMKIKPKRITTNKNEFIAKHGLKKLIETYDIKFKIGETVYLADDIGEKVIKCKISEILITNKYNFENGRKKVKVYYILTTPNYDQYKAESIFVFKTAAQAKKYLQDEGII